METTTVRGRAWYKLLDAPVLTLDVTQDEFIECGECLARGLHPPERFVRADIRNQVPLSTIFFTVTSMTHLCDIFGCKKRPIYYVSTVFVLQEKAWTEKELERRGQGGDLGAPLEVRCLFNLFIDLR